MKTFSLSRELAFLLIAIAVGALLMPAIIYVVGHRLFGAYGTDTAVMSSFYRALLADFLNLQWPAWAILLGPAMVFLTLRWLVFMPTTTATSATATPSTRREPRL